jgi:hypothetical protein
VIHGIGRIQFKLIDFGKLESSVSYSESGWQGEFQRRGRGGGGGERFHAKSPSRKVQEMTKDGSRMTEPKRE